MKLSILYKAALNPTQLLCCSALTTANIIKENYFPPKHKRKYCIHKIRQGNGRKEGRKEGDRKHNKRGGEEETKESR